MNWGIIGAGGIARKFAKTVVQMEQGGEDQHMTAVAARDLQRARDFAEEHHVQKAYGSYEDLLRDPSVDAVYIATPNNLHFEHSRMCLEAGKHVLCEKPFTTSAQDAEELHRLAEEKGLFIMEAFWIRFLPVLKKMREVICSGEIGTVTYARSDYGYIARGARKDRKFDADLGGGALLDIGIYNLGFMRMIFGEMPKNFTSDVHINEYGTDDFSMIQLQYGENVWATVTTSIGMDIPRHAVIIGTEGRIEIPDFQQAQLMEIFHSDGSSYRVEIPFDYTGFEYQVREADRCIAEKRSGSLVYTPEQSLETLRLMDEIRESWNMKFPYEKQ